MSSGAASDGSAAVRDDERVAIVGIGARFAKADDVQAFWRLMVEGRDGFGPIPADRWDFEAFYDANPRSRDKSYTPSGAWIDDIRSFPAVALQVPPRRVEVMDPQQRLALECALQAVDDAGRSPAELPHRTGVFIGITAMEYRTLSSARIMAQMMASGSLGRPPEDAGPLADAVERVLPARPFTAPGVLSNMAAATVAQELRLHGPAFTSDAACASGLVALNNAIEGLRSGSIDAALAGGVYICVTPEHHVVFSRVGAISRSGVCRPFDARADGFVQGDGGGMLLLKRYSDAKRDGDRVYAVIDGLGINNDGGGTGPMAPVKSGQIEVVRQAWADAERHGAALEPSRLGYVEAHGTGTLVGDKIEFEGLREAIGERVRRVALGSSKANYGHTMSGAGIAGLLRAVLAIHHKTIPPMANFEAAKDDVDLAGSPFFVPTEPEPWEGAERVAGVSSFGFGGTNVHVLLSSVPEPSPAPPEQAELILMSSYDEASLRALAGRTADALEADVAVTVAGVSRAWAVRRRQASRLAVVASTKAELIARLRAVGRGDYPEGVVLGTAPAHGEAPKVAFMYPGQGAQRTGMIAGIRDRFPVVADTLAELDAASEGVIDLPVSHLLYPERRATPVDAEAAFAELTQTQHTQPALFAVGAALTRLLAQVGVTPAVVAGHSVGEFTASFAAGVISAADGLRWTARRGQGMAAMTGDRGAMVAIVADRETVEGLLVDGTVIANVNHPRQLVVSGFTDAVHEVARRAEARDLKAVILRVSHGFHSAVFDALDLDAVVDEIPLSDPQVPVASCIVGHAYADADEARAVFKAHAKRPVLWTSVLDQMEAHGARVYLQVGAGGPLESFAKGTLPKGERTILTLASKDDDDGGRSLLLGLGRLWAVGVEVDVTAIAAAAPVASVPPLVLPRERYWVVKDAPTMRMTLAGASERPEATPTTTATATKASPGQVADGAGDASGAVAADGAIDELVFGAVARASAYPRAALRASMRLGDDLGFDSMMVADLAEELGKAIVGFTGIPQEILINSPTIQDIIDFAGSPEATGPALGEVDDDAPLARYGLRWVEAPLPTWGARALGGGRLLAVGDGLDDVVAACEALGYERVADGAAELVIYGAPLDEPAPLTAALAGEVRAPDHAGDLIALLDAQARAGRTPDVIVLRRDDDPWAEAVSGVARCVAREWPDAVVKTLRGDVHRGALVVDELRSIDRSVDVRYLDGARLVMGTRRLDAASPWTPAPDDRVLVTGGTRGIGRALGLALAEAGARVLLLGRKAPDAPLDHPRVSYVAADVTDREALTGALAGRGPITALVHAAGLLADGPLGTVSADAGRLAREVKVDGLLNAVAACGPSLERVLAIGSWAGRFGNANQAHYGAANALMSELVQRLPARIAATAVELGPWSNSDMVRSIPAAMQQAMRAEGVDFVGDEAGQAALREELASGAGAVVRGRHVPAVLRRARRAVALAADTHPFLLDHAIEGVPVLPLAGAATMLADAAGLRAPFEVRDLTLFQGVVVSEPLNVRVVVEGERAELRQGDKQLLSYRATVRELDEAPELPGPLSGGEVPTGLSLADFYEDVTFHGPLLQGLESIDGLGEGFARGHVRCGRPAEWIPATAQPAWAIDPLAFDSAMQLTAYVAWVRYRRAGTPVGCERFVVLRPWPQGEVIAVEARFGDSDDDRFSADLVFRDATGEVIALADGVVAQLREVSDAAPAEGDQAAAEGGHGVSAAVAAGADAEAEPREEVVKTAKSGKAAESAESAESEPPFEVKPEWVDPSLWKDYKDLALRLKMVEAIGLKNPYFDLHEGTARNTTQIAGREVINYSSYNYLGLSGDERVLDAVNVAMRKYGTSVSASRVASGERPFHRELEAALAKAQGVEDAVVMAGGHATNVNTIGHIFGPADLILHDELIHDSCLQGIKLSGAARRSFKHADLDDLDGQLTELRRHYEKVLILIEGVYSMDGDIADLPGYIALKKKHGCLLMVDEAHSFGTIGKTGYGVGEHFLDLGVDLDRRDVDLWMGTMSKSLASMGGWIAGRAELILYLRYTTPGFVFAAGIPPTLGVAALTALRLWTEETWRVADLHRNCELFHAALEERGLDTGPARGESPVIPVVTRDSMHALRLSERLLDDHRINAKPIIFPAVANDAARLRFFLTSLHTEEELLYTADKIAETLADIRAGK